MSMLFEEEDLEVVEGFEQWQRLKINIKDREAFAALADLIGQPLTHRMIWFPKPTFEDARTLPDIEKGGSWTVSPLVAQSDVLEEDDLWKSTWQGMPAYVMLDARPYDSIFVYFKTMADRQAFAQLLDQDVTELARSIWYPEMERHVTTHCWKGGSRSQPRYPVYIISKGRADTRLTAKHFEKMNIPYHIVVEPQEQAAYAAVIDPMKVLVLPFSNLGLGSIPARNWVWDHATTTGADRHWIFDDNINGFYRLTDNMKIPVADGTFLRCMEDFADRYENVAMAGPYYDFFAPRRMVLPPYLLNTRVYSASLLTNKTTMRWRGRYNEDTDLSLRFMKEGWSLVSFYAFLQKKSATMTIKGGNTAELYQGDGRRIMAESLQEQHPDCVTVSEKWGRFQHHVDYRRFRPRNQGGAGLNELRLRPGVVIPDGVDEYDMQLVPVEAPEPRATSSSRPVKSLTPGPSVWAILAGSSDSDPGPMADMAENPGPILANPGPPAVDSDEGSEPAAIKVRLESRGHRLLTRDGKFFVSESSTLTEADRADIKAHREALVAMAVPWVEAVKEVARTSAKAEPIDGAGVSRPAVYAAERSSTGSLFVEEPAQTMAQFLGSAPTRIASSFVPDEPPDLTGIDEVILNFATTGLDWHGGDRPCGVTVSTLDGQMTRFLPFGFAGGNLDEEAVKRWAREQLRHKKVHNSKTKFDVHHSREWGIDLEAQGCTFSDVQHMAALLDDHRKRFALDALAADYFPGERFAVRVDEGQHHRYDAGQVAAREKETAQLVGRLLSVMRPQVIEQELERVQALEDAVIPAVVEMEKNGSPIDMALLELYGLECNRKHDELMLEVSKECGFAFEHTASGWQRLIESLHLPVPDSFSEGVLNEVDHPLVRKGQRAAQYASLNSKIFKSYPEHIVDGILRYSINQLASDDGGTVSGRFSVPIVQQVPNEGNHQAAFGDELFPRRLYIAADGDYLEGDAAQIEFRLLVHYSENAKLLQAYRDDPEMSFHKKMQEMLKAYKPDMQYGHTKNYNFASQYGAKSIKLAIMMGFINSHEGDAIREAKAWNDPKLALIKDIERAYKSAHPEAGALLDRASHLAKSSCDKYCKPGDQLHRQYPHRGYVKTLLGRRSRFPTNYKTYIGLNRVLQGTGADIMKQKLVELHAMRKETGFVMRITNHDAVLGDATTPETLTKVTAALNAQSFPLKVPILWKCGTGRSWAECK